jgi:hypothetical protein
MSSASFTCGPIPHVVKVNLVDYDGPTGQYVATGDDLCAGHRARPDRAAGRRGSVGHRRPARAKVLQAEIDAAIARA